MHYWCQTDVKLLACNRGRSSNVMIYCFLWSCLLDLIVALREIERERVLKKSTQNRVWYVMYYRPNTRLWSLSPSPRWYHHYDQNGLNGLSVNCIHIFISWELGLLFRYGYRWTDRCPRMNLKVANVIWIHSVIRVCTI